LEGAAKAVVSLREVGLEAHRFAEFGDSLIYVPFRRKCDASLHVSCSVVLWGCWTHGEREKTAEKKQEAQGALGRHDLTSSLERAANDTTARIRGLIRP
jgi:hypothetical protein